jgi:hypothetical protein
LVGGSLRHTLTNHDPLTTKASASNPPACRSVVTQDAVLALERSRQNTNFHARNARAAATPPLGCFETLALPAF